MTPAPAFEAFAAAYEAGAPQVVYTRLIDDLETPVSAYLKIGLGRPYAFLFESVEGGSSSGSSSRERRIRSFSEAKAGPSGR